MKKILSLLCVGVMVLFGGVAMVGCGGIDLDKDVQLRIRQDFLEQFCNNEVLKNVKIKYYYGTFDGGVAVIMRVKVKGGDGSFDWMWEEVVDGDIGFKYNNADRIRIWNDGEFYTLTESFKAGTVTTEDLRQISEAHARRYS